MDKATRAYTEFKYNRHMKELRNLHQNSHDYVNDVCPYKWSRVHYFERRYRVMTVNVTECIKSCLKFTRQLPMLTLAEFIRNMLQWWFHDLYRAAQFMHHQLTDVTYLVILKRVEKEKNLNFTSLSSDYYKRQTLIDPYLVLIILVGHPSTWVVPSDMVILNPISRRQAGRPRAGRHVSSSERKTTRSCRRCGQPEHNSRRCSNPHLINEGQARGVPDEYRRKCSICH
ncbi:hypothetical protein Ddye_005393 [Dipteronia dyeriana]|uniref:CCHC-type domain-containing protein n=1 Tax=Dipteronia dyeriana TaxID=168575 RepID=A0AAD9XG30_9ROSI|nr:hypothetical protein Ddye_005393 [Dipteronia dyeriana]